MHSPVLLLIAAENEIECAAATGEVSGVRSSELIDRPCASSDAVHACLLCRREVIDTEHSTSVHALLPITHGVPASIHLQKLTASA